MMDLLVALIIAKKESKRLLNKNTLSFQGKPMFLWNVDKCCLIFDKTYVSSENPEILQLAQEAGAIPIKRPKSLCDTPNIPVYQHALKEMDNPDAIVAVQANSPTLDIDLIKKIVLFMKTGRYQEIMTCHSNHTLYGSVWALTANRLNSRKKKRNPDFLLIDKSIDIHTQEDFQKAKEQYVGHLNNHPKLQ